MSFKSWSSDLDARTKAKPADKSASDAAPAVQQPLPQADKAPAEGSPAQKS